MPAKDGGPAFPGTDYYDEKPFGSNSGMTLRDYFAAHAPAEMHSWFEAKLPPRPEPAFDHDHPNMGRCQTLHDCIPINHDELSAYDDERRREYELQWPYAWADAMLAERAK